MSFPFQAMDRSLEDLRLNPGEDESAREQQMNDAVQARAALQGELDGCRRHCARLTEELEELGARLREEQVTRLRVVYSSLNGCLPT